jgi:hypothetical protein
VQKILEITIECLLASSGSIVILDREKKPLEAVTYFEGEERLTTERNWMTPFGKDCRMGLSRTGSQHW